jgi:hypothetical protein
MQSMTVHEAREYCKDLTGKLRIAEDDSFYFDVDEEVSFLIQSPADFRNIGFLSHAISACAPKGGLLWLRLLYGSKLLVEIGQEIIESMRRPLGDVRTLDIAPVLNFESNEHLQLEIALMQVIGNGWNGYFVPTEQNFVIGFRSSHRISLRGESKDRLSNLLSSLDQWSPQEALN